MQKSRITLTLHGAYEGKTIVLNRRQFVNGVLAGTGSPEDLVGLQKYYTTAYNCSCVIEPLQAAPKPEPVLTPDEPVKDINEQEVMIPEPPTPECPTERQELICLAIEGVDKTDWISGPIDHPRVTDVATILNDPTVTTEEIMECMERWWVEEAKEEAPVIEEPEVEEAPVQTDFEEVKEEPQEQEQTEE